MMTMLRGIGFSHKALFQVTLILLLFAVASLGEKDVAVAGEAFSKLGQTIRNQLKSLRVPVVIAEVLGVINDILGQTPETANTKIEGGDIKKGPDSKEKRVYVVRGDGLSRAQMRELELILKEVDGNRNQSISLSQETTSGDVSQTQSCSSGLQISGNNTGVSVSINNSSTNCNN